jgi:hypothetical protein
MAKWDDEDGNPAHQEALARRWVTDQADVGIDLGQPGVARVNIPGLDRHRLIIPAEVPPLPEDRHEDWLTDAQKEAGSIHLLGIHGRDEPVTDRHLTSSNTNFFVPSEFGPISTVRSSLFRANNDDGFGSFTVERDLSDDPGPDSRQERSATLLYGGGDDVSNAERWTTPSAAFYTNPDQFWEHAGGILGSTGENMSESSRQRRLANRKGLLVPATRPGQRPAIDPVLGIQTGLAYDEGNGTFRRAFWDRSQGRTGLTTQGMTGRRL